MKTSIKNPLIVALLSSSLGIASLAGAAKAPVAAKPEKAKAYKAEKAGAFKAAKPYKAEKAAAFKKPGFKAARSSW